MAAERSAKKGGEGVAQTAETSDGAPAGPAVWATHDRAEAARAAGEDVILFTVGDPSESGADADLAGRAAEAAAASLLRGPVGYGPALGAPSLRAAIAADAQRRLGLRVGPENVAVTLGAQGALFAAAALTTEPGDEILGVGPLTPTAVDAVHAAGAWLKSVPPGPGFRVDLDAVAASVAPETRALMLASPANPTGVMLSDDEAEGLAEIVRARDLWLISDEVYGRLGYDRPHASPASIAGMAGRTLVIDSLSKGHGMPGWRVGWAIGPESAVSRLEELALAQHLGLSPFVQAGAVAALTLGDAATSRMRKGYRRRRDLLARLTAATPGLTPAPAEGGLYVLVDVRGAGWRSDAFSAALFDEERVATTDAAVFDPALDGYVRFALTVPEERISEAFVRIGRFLRRR